VSFSKCAGGGVDCGESVNAQTLRKAHITLSFDSHFDECFPIVWTASRTGSFLASLLPRLPRRAAHSCGMATFGRFARAHASGLIYRVRRWTSLFRQTAHNSLRFGRKLTRRTQPGLQMVRY
jgi:hypothetical protein